VQELGGIGAPTFQVLDPERKAVAILWGHDRLNIVANLLCDWREIEERDRGTQETWEELEEATTGRVRNNEDGEQQIQAQQHGLINNNIAFSVNAALLLPPASAAPLAAVSTVCTTQKPFAKKLRSVSH
jgi:hypothetical protein